MAEEPDTSATESDPGRSALDRYLEHQERMRRYDAEYLERLKQQEPETPPPVTKRRREARGFPVCDKCSRRRGCRLLEAMVDVETFVGLDGG